MSLIPPTSGTFGGGQGQILYVEHDDYASQVKRIDLANRQVQTVTQISRGPLYGLVGGVSRAFDGSFLVTDYALSLDSASKAYLHRADGKLLSDFTLRTMVVGGATLSPDGASIAYVCSERARDGGRTGSVVYLVVIDTRTGQSVGGIVVDLDDPESDKIALASSALTVWAADLTLYVAMPGRLYRADRATAATTRLHDLPLSAPRGLTVSPDSSQIWFQSTDASPHGTSIWSIEIGTGNLIQRAFRSQRGYQHNPTFSPDGQWLLIQQSRLASYSGQILTEYFDVSAVRRPESLIDTESLALQILDASGKPFEAKGSMAWF